MITSISYIEFLEKVISDLPLNVRQNLWFQHVGASAHFTAAVRDLNTIFGRVLSCGLRLLTDVARLDFFLWCEIKKLVYDSPIYSKKALIARIRAGA